MGIGHVMRCLALAQAGKDVGCRVVFAMASCSAGMAQRLQSENVEVVQFACEPGSRNDAIATVEVAKSCGSDWLVLDGYHFNTPYQAAIKDSGLKLLVLDDFGALSRYVADIIVNQDPVAGERLYDRRDANTRLLLGPNYTFLRREFRQHPRPEREFPAMARRLLFTFLAALTVFRLLYLTQIELSPDEAYYFQWAQHLDWSYFSKGPGIALAMWLSTHIFGDTVFGIRVLSPLLALATSLLMFSFARRLYGETVAIWSVLMLSFIPMFQVGAMLMTIDPLSMFFWMAGLYTCWLALEKSPAFNLWWPATGAVIGLGFLAKYTNAMQIVSILLLLAFTPKYRREFRRAGIYALLVVFAIFASPVIIWNAQHAWITVLHLRDRGGLDTPPRFRPMAFLTFLGMQFGVYSPLIYGAMLAGLVWAWKISRTHLKPRFLVFFTLPIFVLYFVLALKKPGEPNWTAPAMLSLGVLTVVYWLDLSRKKNWARIYAVAGLAMGGILSLLAIDTDLLRDTGLPVAVGSDPSARLRGWHTTAGKIDEIRLAYEASQNQRVFLIANKYGTAANLGFYLPHPRPVAEGHPPVYVPESAWPENQYYFWPRYDGLVDYTDAAREKLAAGSGIAPALRAELAAALAEISGSDSPSDEARQRFLRALKTAAPELGIDDYFAESFGYNPFLGRTALYITDDCESYPPDVFDRTFAHSEMIACFDVLRHGQSLRQIRVFACTGYHLQEL